jgi:probable HAF family extracellular repeat protein
MYRRFIVIFAFLGLSLPVAGAAWAQYYVTDLGVLSGGNTSEAYGVNSAGQVVGFSMNTSDPHGAETFLYSNGTMSDIGQYYAAYPNSATGGVGWKIGGGINDNGTVAWTDNGPTTTAYSFLYSGGTTVTPLDTLSGVGNNPTFVNNISFATGITDNGLVCGFYTSSAGYHHPFLCNTNTGTITDLGNLGTVNAETKGMAVNSSGMVVGYGQIGGIIDASYHMFYWTSTTGIQPLVSFKPSTDDGYGMAINSSGQVVGSFVTGGAEQGPSDAFICQAGATNVTDLGALANGAQWGTNSNLLYRIDRVSAAAGINDAGVVVGYSMTDYNGDPHAFVWTSAAGMQDLNSMISPAAGWTLQYAQAVSSNGYIAGYGVNSAGATDAYLLTPALPGDANLDGKVDINDLTIVLAHYNQSGTTWAGGEFTGDGTVDINDLTIVLAHYNDTAGSCGAGSPAAVPEPGALALLAAALAGVAALASCARRRS